MQNTGSSLDDLIKKICKIEGESGALPPPEKERHLIQVQLLAAQIIVEDLLKIKEVSPYLSNREIIDYLLHNWTENMRGVISAIMVKNVVGEEELWKNEVFSKLVPTP
ncbi:MAG: hypothetical protein LBS14_00685 [Holosporaceae bacterium]|jgi:hypothetical protein|nr:hypothetical protein [Holosporaceae bacterium]